MLGLINILFFLHSRILNQTSLRIARRTENEGIDTWTRYLLLCCLLDIDLLGTVGVEQRLVVSQHGFSQCQLSPSQFITIDDEVKQLVDVMRLLQVRPPSVITNEHLYCLLLVCCSVLSCSQSHTDPGTLIASFIK